jgi:N-acetylglucosamine kinase-like BadF-type ATPase
MASSAEIQPGGPGQIHHPAQITAMTVMNGYFLGVDGGGTKTHAVISDADCHLIAEGLSGGSNPVRLSVDEASRNIEEAIAEACRHAGLRLEEITAGCAALAGISQPIHFQAMKESLDRLGIPNLRLVIDADAALTGALDGQSGVVVIAGTGSIALGVNSEGRTARSGGWGPTLSDEGSAYDIARHALRAVVASFDGRSEKTVLTERLLERLGVQTPAELPSVVYSEESESVEIASLADIVTEAARDGDEVARNILESAGKELGRLATSVIERLGMRSCGFRVAFVGTVFKSAPPVLAAFRDAVVRYAPGAIVSPPLLSPALGAAKLAVESVVTPERL